MDVKELLHEGFERSRHRYGEYISMEIDRGGCLDYPRIFT